MNRFAILAALVFSLATPTVLAQKDETHTYKVDPGHTSIVFKINHLGFSNTYGMLPKAEGKVIWNEANPEKSSIEVSVNATDISTHEKKRDDHLRGPDFFNIKQFPKISLKTKSIKKSGEGKYDAEGDLTLHGQTKPLSFTFQHFKTGKDPFGLNRIGGEAKFTIKRSQFAMTYMNQAGGIGDDVEMVVSLEGTRP